MLTTLVTILFSGLVCQQTSLAVADEGYGYVIGNGSRNIPNISCTTDPINGQCRFNHEVATSELSDVGAALSKMKSTLEMTLSGIEGASKKRCVETADEYFCKMAFSMRCNAEYIVQDIAGIKRSCKKAEKYCMNVTGGRSFMLPSLINCSTPVEPVQPIKRPASFQCSYFPDVKDDPYTCAKRNYKVFPSNLTEQARGQVEIHKNLMSYGNNISQQCLNDLSELICETTAPACDRNETMIVSLVSKQECERRISCINATAGGKELTNEFEKMCRNLPDANTAAKIPLSLVYTGFEPNHQSPNVTGESHIPKTPTEEPYVNSTYQTSSTKAANLTRDETKGEENQTNDSETDTKTKPTSGNPTSNATSKVKSVSSVKPKSESLLDQNDTSQDQLSTKLAKTPKQNTTSSPLVGNATANPTKSNATSKVKSVPSLKPTSTKLAKTPKLNATSSAIVRHVNATANPTGFNVTTVFSMTVTFSVPAHNCSNTTNCSNKAPSTKMNGFGFLVISVLSNWVWHMQ